MTLAKLPPMFGIDELKKGYFPHLFNRRENQTVIMNHLTDIKYYCVDAMKPNDIEMCLHWYAEHRNDKFDLQKGLLEYCNSDAYILGALLSPVSIKLYEHYRYRPIRKVQNYSISIQSSVQNKPSTT